MATILNIVTDIPGILLDHPLLAGAVGALYAVVIGGAIWTVVRAGR